MPTITRVRGDRVRIRNCVRNVTVQAGEGGFEYPLQLTDLVYGDDQESTLYIAGVHNENPTTHFGGSFGNASRDYIYDTDGDWLYYSVSASLRKVHLDGTGDTPVGTWGGGQTVCHSVLKHPSGDKAWAWVERKSATGVFTDVQLRLYTFPFPTDLSNFTLLATFTDNFAGSTITQDIDRGYIYAGNGRTGTNNGKIYRIAWDGSLQETLTSETGGIHAVQYDPTLDKIFYMGGSSNLRRCNPDGSSKETLAAFGIAQYRSMRLNIAGRYLLLANGVADTGDIREYLLDGTLHSTIRSQGAGQAIGSLSFIY